MKLFPTLPTDLGNRCDNYHISTATTTTGMNEFLRNKQPNEVGPIRRAKGAKSSRQNQVASASSISPPSPGSLISKSSAHSPSPSPWLA